MNTYSILIVDDEPDNFDVIQSLLPGENYRLHYAISGEHAIASLDKFDPDVILLDVMMPGLNGIEVCKQIKAMSKWQSVPIVMVTALSGKEDLARCLTAGADDFVNKPVNGIELRARVSSMLRIKKQHDRIQSFSKLQRHNIHSLTNDLNEIRLDLAAEFSCEFDRPLDIISETTEHLTENIEQLSTAAIIHILGQNNRSTLQLRKLMKKFWFYLQLVAERPESNYGNASIPKSIVEQSLKNRFKEIALPGNIIYEVEDTQLAVNTTHFQWICDELIEYVISNINPRTRTRIFGEVIDDMFHFSLTNYQRDVEKPSMIEMTKSIQLNTSTYEERELKIGLKIVKKLVNNYDGVFLLSGPNEAETAVYLTLPLVPQRLPMMGSVLKTPTVSVEG
ncbi:response regulator [Chamaesiphon minutus]|uniref:Response regulator with CheY-like receiver domain and winged-helix DNA-binding domain n=1 Tax=Chamaesiphon minutus (strain ATCC 27169 / PCC 6605) TaxID=1173020 RepID=K9UD68_CHAP6|nr:response regulator [Chamaesiphon minutus]AFY92159.1 response regulator with CheY-like receiver domain and winged-helix DNA-binding domain [Chamaesiphon minutus PCC 6605]